MLRYLYRSTAGTIKATAFLTAVVFLLIQTGCHSTAHHRVPERHKNISVPKPGKPAPGSKKIRRSRAGEYSRIPGNYPASWQTRTIGH